MFTLMSYRDRMYATHRQQATMTTERRFLSMDEYLLVCDQDEKLQALHREYEEQKRQVQQQWELLQKRWDREVRQEDTATSHVHDAQDLRQCIFADAWACVEELRVLVSNNTKEADSSLEHAVSAPRHVDSDLSSLPQSTDKATRGKSAPASNDLVACVRRFLDVFALSRQREEAARRYAKQQEEQQSKEWHQCTKPFLESVAAINTRLAQLELNGFGSKIAVVTASMAKAKGTSDMYPIPCAPFQLENHAVRSPSDEAQNTVSFSVSIEDADGVPIWETRCYATGIVIEPGKLRYRSLSHPKADRLPQVARVQQALLQLLKEARSQSSHDALKQLEEEDPRITDWVVLEQNHPTPMYLAATRGCDLPSFTMPQLLEQSCRTYGLRPCLGRVQLSSTQRLDPVAADFHGPGIHPQSDLDHQQSIPSSSPSPSLPDNARDWQWLTYNEVWERAVNLARGTKHIACHSTRHSSKTTPIERWGILAHNSPDWVIADLACCLARCTSVAFHTTWTDEQVYSAIQKTKITVLFVGLEYLKRISAVLSAAHGTCTTQTVTLVACCQDAVALAEASASLGYHVWDMNAVISIGQSCHGQSGDNGTTFVTPNASAATTMARHIGSVTSSHAIVDKEGNAVNRVQMLQFTSGSTALPKATEVLEHRFCQAIVQPGCQGIDPMVLLVASPLSLAAERLAVFSALANGGRVGFRPSREPLTPLLQSLRPTSFSAPPIFWSSLYSEYCVAISKSTTKPQSSDADSLGDVDNDRETEVVARVRQRFRSFIGNRCTSLGTGGAFVPHKVLQWMRDCFGTQKTLVGENYGCTEAGNISTNGVVDSIYHIILDNGSGNVMNWPDVQALHPGKSACLRLKDHEDLGYTSRDKPYPRGEVCVRNSIMSLQYFDDAAHSRAAWDEDGFYCTGDIAELLPGRRLRLIGRCHSQVKLANGYFVSPDALEAIFTQCECVALVYVHVDRASVLCAAVVPPLSTLSTLSDPSCVQCYQQLVADSFAQVAKLHGLPSHELPQHIYVDLSGKDWTEENGLLTPSGKPHRTNLGQHYAPRFEDLAFEVPQTDEHSRLMQSTDDEESQAHNLVKAQLISLVKQLACGHGDPMPVEQLLSHSFAELGGTSVAAMQFMVRLSTINPDCNALSTGALLHRPLNEVAALLEGCAPNGQSLLQWNTSLQRHVEADIEMDCRLPDIAGASHLIQPIELECHDILLTGATGFVGAHVLRDLLIHPSLSDVGVWCVVRADSQSGLCPSDRLKQCMVAFHLWQANFADRIRVVEGSLEQPLFGLDRDVYNALVKQVSTVFHAGARVAFWDSYSEAKVNVIIMHQVLHFCVASAPRKTLLHCSTLSVFGRSIIGTAIIDETTPIGTDVRASGIAGVEGYSQSKWVCEQLVAQAVQAPEWHIDARVLRLGLVGWSTKTQVANSQDWLTRLVDATLLSRVGFPDQGQAINVVPVDYAAHMCVQHVSEARKEHLQAQFDLKVPHGSGVAVHVGDVDTAPRTPLFAHICNTNGSTSLGLFMRCARDHKLIDRREPSYSLWIEYMRALGPSNPLFTLLPWLKHGLPNSPDYALGLQPLTLPPCPEITISAVDDFVRARAQCRAEADMTVSSA
eukprot:m.33271 g.33271  ORF g.33271 m.33271 type:complete len:1609 (+) comp9604_c0_seq1:45-4871(+)